MNSDLIRILHDGNPTYPLRYYLDAVESYEYIPGVENSDLVVKILKWRPPLCPPGAV